MAHQAISADYKANDHYHNFDEENPQWVTLT